MNDFRIVRQNALANPSLYGGRYTQEDETEAYAEYLRDVTISLELSPADEFYTVE